MIEALGSVLLAAVPSVETRSCEAQLDETFARQVAIEWSSAPAGATVIVSCTNERVELRLEAPGFRGRVEEAALPDLSVEARSRLLALLAAERGRTLQPARAPLVAAEVLPPIESTPAAPDWSPLPGSLWWLAARSERSLAWRVGASAVATTPLWLGPWRLGPRVALSNGPLTVGLSASFGGRSVTYEAVPLTGARVNVPVIAQSASIEPEFALVGVGGRWWSARLLARALLGYGVLSSPGTEEVTSGSVVSVEAGGAGVLAVAVRLTDFLLLEFDAALGWAWAAYGTIRGQPVAALGGGVVSMGLGLGYAWGAR